MKDEDASRNDSGPERALRWPGAVPELRPCFPRIAHSAEGSHPKGRRTLEAGTSEEAREENRLTRNHKEALYIFSENDFARIARHSCGDDARHDGCPNRELG